MSVFKKMAEFKISLILLLPWCFVNVNCQDHESLPCVPVQTRTCPGITPKAELTSVYIQDCIAEPCAFKKGQDVYMEMDIKFKEPVESIQAKLHAIIGFPIPWDGVDPKACDYIVSEGECPFKKNDFITYGAKFNVNRAYPSVTADVRYTILDQDGEVQVCWIVRASVVNP